MTDFEEKTRRLSETAAFREMPVEMLGEIAQVIEDRVIPAKTLLFKRGDPGDSFWVIQTGKVRVFRRDDKGTEITFSELGPGKSFGEMALLTGEPRSASVETLEESRLMVLSKDQFDGVLKSHPDLSLSFIKQLSGWLKRDEQALRPKQSGCPNRQDGLVRFCYPDRDQRAFAFSVQPVESERCPFPRCLPGGDSAVSL
jgi:CRP-like cAMP-binding protein